MESFNDNNSFDATPQLSEHPNTTSILTLFRKEDTDIGIITEAMYEFRHFFDVITYTSCVFGIVVNSLNLAVFYKQGSSDSVNISLFCLALTDFTMLVDLLAYRGSSWYLEAIFKRIPFQVRHLGGYIANGLALNSSWLALFISVERSLCISRPLKVKDIIRPKVTMIAISCIAAVSAICVLPALSALRIRGCAHIDQTTNGTIFVKDGLELFLSDDVLYLTSITFIMSSSLQITSFLALIFATGILAISLNRQSRKRNRTLGLDNSGQLSVRDRKVVKMVVIISGIIVLSFLPSQALSISSSAVAEFNTQRRFDRLSRLLWSVAIMLWSVNSSVNIFVYWRISSKYRRTLLDLIKSPCCRLRSSLAE